MSCLVKMRAVREELSANEKKIADFILNNAGLIRDCSSQNLAASVGVSQSSIIKFSQKLNYRGFTDLKLAIHESVVRNDSDDYLDKKRRAGDNRADSVREQLFNIKTESLLTTMELNDNERILSAVGVLEKSQRIQMISFGSGSLAARNFATMLTQIGRPVIAEMDTCVQLSSMATLGKGDAVFVISSSGQSAKMIPMLQQARKAGVTIVSLTNYSVNPIRSMADVSLFSVKCEAEIEVRQAISTASQQHVVDVLFSSMLQKNSKARELLARSLLAAESL